MCERYMSLSFSIYLFPYEVFMLCDALSILVSGLPLTIRPISWPGILVYVVDG